MTALPAPIRPMSTPVPSNDWVSQPVEGIHLDRAFKLRTLAVSDPDDAVRGFPDRFFPLPDC